MTTSYSIQACAERVGLTASALRYYERKGLTPAVARGKNGHRCYSDDDIMWIEFVMCMRKTGMPLREIRAFGELHFGNGSLHERLGLLEAHHERMVAQRATLDEAIEKIGEKIGRFQTGIARLEANGAKT